MNQYELWNRALNDLKGAVERLENELIINKVLVYAARKELNKHNKPKKVTNPIVR